MKWLHRDVHTLALQFALCLSDADFQKELKRLKIDEKIGFLKNEHSSATTQFFVNKTGAHCAIVCLKMDPAKTLEQVHALLVHEGMHIWREYLDLIGERNPSSEFEAYGIQLISQELMVAYRELSKPVRRKPTAKSRKKRK